MPTYESNPKRLAYKSAYKKKMRLEGKLNNINIEFYSSDMELYEHARAQGSMARYIKGLIRRDMEARA